MLDNQAKMPGRLLIAPPPFPDENLIGYLVRLTEANGYESLQILHQAITGHAFVPNFPKKYYEFLMGEYRQLFCSLTGILPVVIDQIEERRNLISGKANQMFLKFCAECLKEQAYYRLVWDNSLYCACHNHRTILIDVCHACKEKFQWGSNRISYCRCGYDIRNSPPHAARNEAVLVCNKILELCGLTIGDTSQVFSSEWSAVNLTEFGELLTMMAEIRADFIEVKPLSQESESDKRHEIIAEAYKLLQFWPHTFNKFINSLPDSTYKKMLDSWSRYMWTKNLSVRIVLEVWRNLIEQRWPDGRKLESIIIRELFQSVFGGGQSLIEQQQPVEETSENAAIKEIFRSLFMRQGT